MKLGEEWIDEGDRIVRKNTFDVDSALAAVDLARQAPSSPVSDSWHVASVPMWLVNEWLKEAGVQWNDKAARDVIRRKLISGDFNAFRVKQGTF